MSAPHRETLLPDGARPALHDGTRWIGSWVFFLIYRLRVRGRSRVPATGPLVLVANHSALIDGPLLYGLLGRRCVFLVKSEMYRWPLGPILLALGQLPVRRGEPDRTPLLAAVRTLRAGGVVAVFPEGTRGTGEVASAQQGAAWLARSADAVVLPVACRGTRRPGDRRRFRPRVDVLIGQPVAVSTGRGRAALGVATERIRGELASLVAQLDELRSGAGVGPSTPDGQRRHGE